MLRHLLQPHAMTYNIRSYPEVFYKKVFLKVSQNSQKSSCTDITFLCNFDKKEAVAQMVSCEFCEIDHSTNDKCVQMFPKKVYICCVHIYIKLVVMKKITTNAAVVL